MKVISWRDRAEIERIKARSSGDLQLALSRVAPVLKDVRTFGDKAVFGYSEKFDNYKLTKTNIRIKDEEIKRAYKQVDQKILRALKEAAGFIRRFAQKELPKEWTMTIDPGIKVGKLVRPLDRVGCYVPGGSFPLPSTVLMTVIPAKVAGVKEIIVCTPPRENSNAILAAADIAGADEVYRVGGAQAIAAMAYGTASIPKVNMIVGPGNIFVTAAKKLAYGDVGIDFIAGPSEVLIYASHGEPAHIASDLLSQAEHDVHASAVLVTTNKHLAEAVDKEVEMQLKALDSTNASTSIRDYGAIIICGSVDEAFDLINDFAPEHLEIHDEDEKLLKKVRNAGAIFLGPHSPEPAGDYCLGNHVLPTSGFARVRSGLSVMDFIKMPTIEQLTKKGLERIKDTLSVLAEAEGLTAHKRSIEKRFKQQ